MKVVSVSSGSQKNEFEKAIDEYQQNKSKNVSFGPGRTPAYLQGGIAQIIDKENKQAGFSKLIFA